MSQFLISVLAVGVILGFMILIHELGHYATAKLLGVRVEVFSIGFGKRLLGFRKGDTDYRISAIPLGGYVKMSGENPMDERSGDPAEFLSHPRWHRFIIAIAGPVMNIALAIGLLTVVYMVHYESASFLDQPAVIAWVKPDSAAGKAGLQHGDKIIQIDDVSNPTWDQVYFKVMVSPNQPLSVAVQRGNERIDQIVTPRPVSSSQVGSAGWFAEESVVLGKLDSGMPAEKAGMKEGDKILLMDGKPLPSIEAMIDSLQQSKGKPITLSVLRAGQELEFQVNPVLAATEDPSEKRYRIGFRPKFETTVSRLPLPAALRQSVADNKKESGRILLLVKKLVQGKASLKMMSGPIGIAQDAGEAAQQEGWTPLLTLSAAISLNLGIFNLLPIPIMDGGVIMLLFIESLMRREISLQVKERIYQVAFVFLILFAVTVIYNDVLKIIPGLAGHRMQ
jgi:regulator of sigma E protease